MKRTGLHAILGALFLALASGGATAQLSRSPALIASSPARIVPRPLDRAPSYCHGRTFARWIPGAYQTVTRRVWIPACDERVYVEPVYSYRIDACGRTVRILEREGHWISVARPGHFEWESVEVWVPGHWST